MWKQLKIHQFFCKLASQHVFKSSLLMKLTTSVSKLSMMLITFKDLNVGVFNQCSRTFMLLLCTFVACQKEISRQESLQLIKNENFIFRLSQARRIKWMCFVRRRQQTPARLIISKAKNGIFNPFRRFICEQCSLVLKSFLATRICFFAHLAKLSKSLLN